MAVQRVTVFDLDDTLYPERAFAFSGYEAVAQAFADRLGRPANRLVARMRELFDSPHRGRVFNVLVDALGVAGGDAIVPGMIDAFRFHRPAIQLFPDADNALTRLRGQCRLGLISDGPLPMQSNKIDALGLRPRLDEIILTDQWGREFWKPHPRAFEEMSNRLGAPPTTCTYVADNPAKDFIAPNALGWRTVCVRRPDGLYANQLAPPGGEPQDTVSSLEALGPG